MKNLWDEVLFCPTLPKILRWITILSHSVEKFVRWITILSHTTEKFVWWITILYHSAEKLVRWITIFIKLFCVEIFGKKYGILEMQVFDYFIKKTSFEFCNKVFPFKVFFCKYFDMWYFILTPLIFWSIIKPTYLVASRNF